MTKNPMEEMPQAGKSPEVKEEIVKSLAEYIKAYKEIMLPSNEISENIKTLPKGSCFWTHNWEQYEGCDYRDLVYVDSHDNIVKVNVKEDNLIIKVQSFIDKQEQDPQKWQLRDNLKEQTKKELEDLGFVFNIDEATQKEIIELVSKYNKANTEKRTETARKEFDL